MLSKGGGGGGGGGGGSGGGGEILGVVVVVVVAWFMFSFGVSSVQGVDTSVCCCLRQRSGRAFVII